MYQFKTVAFGVVFVILSISLLMAVKSNNFNNNNSRDLLSLSKNDLKLSEPNFKLKEFSELRDQLNRLMKQSNTQAQALEDLQQQSPDNAPDLSDSSQEIQSVNVDHMDSEQLIQAELEYTKQIVSVLDSEMSNQKQDETWAPEMEDTVATTLEEGSFEGTELLNVVCQSSLCRIEIEHENSNAEEKFLHKFIPAAGYTDTEVFFARSEGTDGGSHMTYYVSRDGQQMPVLERDN